MNLAAAAGKSLTNNAYLYNIMLARKWKRLAPGSGSIFAQRLPFLAGL